MLNETVLGAVCVCRIGTQYKAVKPRLTRKRLHTVPHWSAPRERETPQTSVHRVRGLRTGHCGRLDSLLDICTPLTASDARLMRRDARVRDKEGAGASRAGEFRCRAPGAHPPHVHTANRHVPVYVCMIVWRCKRPPRTRSVSALPCTRAALAVDTAELKLGAASARSARISRGGLRAEVGPVRIQRPLQAHPDHTRQPHTASAGDGTPHLQDISRPPHVDAMRSLQATRSTRAHLLKRSRITCKHRMRHTV
jgi:hypothetical protein|mmetsp:Transcript_27938/g.63188  ORF Transcript_27938/g.63188 Transcript_27938/m.63188 type:complete len:252 (+) Transcript_27938:6-761(+)